VVSAEQVCGLVLGKVVADVAVVAGAPVGAAVIAVPACFDAAQRRGVLAAAGLAGVPVLRLISEPTAVALAYGLHTRYAQTVLVVDVGGGSLDVAVVRTGYGLVEVVAAGGDDRLGGDDFDTVLAEHLAGRGRRELGEDPLADAEMSQRLRAVARRAKVALSYLDSTEVVLPGGGRLGLTRPELEQVTAGLRRRLDPPIRQVLAAAGLTPTDLDQTIVVGAGSRMPAIRAQLHHLTRPGPPPVSIHPEETTACGAAIQAAILTGLHCDATVWDVTAFALVLQEPDGRRRRLLEANTSIPVRATTTVDPDPSLRGSLTLIQVPGHGRGERPVARFAIRGEERGPVRLAFDVDDDGLVAVSICDHATGAERPVECFEAIGVDRAVPASGVSTAPPAAAAARSATLDDRITDAHLALARDIGEDGHGEPRPRRPARPGRLRTTTLTSQ